MSHITCQCQGCTAWNPQGTCTELKSPHYGSDVSPFHIACNQFLSRHTVFAPKNIKRKKWFRVKTMEDMEIPGARLY